MPICPDVVGTMALATRATSSVVVVVVVAVVEALASPKTATTESNVDEYITDCTRLYKVLPLPIWRMSRGESIETE